MSTETLVRGGLLGCLLVIASCAAALPPKPGCAPGEGTLVAAKCRAAAELGEITIAECHTQVDQWQAGCLR